MEAYEWEQIRILETFILLEDQRCIHYNATNSWILSFIYLQLFKLRWRGYELLVNSHFEHNSDITQCSHLLEVMFFFLYLYLSSDCNRGVWRREAYYIYIPGNPIFNRWIFWIKPAWSWNLRFCLLWHPTRPGKIFILNLFLF